MIPHKDMICFALYATSQAMQHTYRPLLADIGLTYPQYLVMLVLWNVDDPMTVGALGDAVNLESNTLTPILKRMEKSDLITRTRVEADQRRVSVQLTPQGHALKARAAHIPACIEARTGLGSADLADLTARLSKLSATLLAPWD